MAIDSPVDAVAGQFKEPTESAVDLILLGGKVAVPVAAPLLELVGMLKAHFSASGREGRWRAFLELLRDQEKLLEALKERHDRLAVKVEDLAEAIEVAAWSDVNAPNDRKRDRFAKIIGNAARSEDKIEGLSAFIRDVESLGEGDITALRVLNRVMNKPGDWRNLSGPGTVNKVHPKYLYSEATGTGN